jgi:hypothetical protein
MELRPPFSISARLLPALVVADGTISLEFTGTSHDGRDEYTMHVDIPAGEFSERGLRSGCDGASLQAMFASALAFLSAAAESYSYRTRTGHEGENESLFPAPVVEWAHQNSDEISMLACELEESPELIVE